MLKKISLKVRGRETCTQLAGALVVAGFQVSASSGSHYSGAKKAWVDEDVFTIWLSADIEGGVPLIGSSTPELGDGAELFFSYGPEQDRAFSEEGHRFCGAACLNPAQARELASAVSPKQQCSSEIHVFVKKKSNVER